MFVLVYPQSGWAFLSSVTGDEEGEEEEMDEGGDTDDKEDDEEDASFHPQMNRNAKRVALAADPKNSNKRKLKAQQQPAPIPGRRHWFNGRDAVHFLDYAFFLSNDSVDEAIVLFRTLTFGATVLLTGIYDLSQ